MRSPRTIAFVVSFTAASAAVAELPWLDWGAPEVAEISWIDNPRQAVLEAQRTGRPILAYATSDNCGHCRKMERDTWADAGVGRLVTDRFVPLKLDAVRHRAEVAALRVRAYPTTVLISTQGNVVAGRAGYLDPTELAALLDPKPAAGQLTSRQ